MYCVQRLECVSLALSVALSLAQSLALSLPLSLEGKSHWALM